MTAHSMRCFSATSRLQRFQCGALRQPRDHNAFQCGALRQPRDHNAFQCGALRQPRDHNTFNAVLFGNLTITTLSMRCSLATSRLQRFQCGALWQPRDHNAFQCGALWQPRENVDKRCFIRFRPIAELARDKINSSKRLKERGVIAIIDGIF